MARNGAGTFAILNPILVGALRSSSAVNANFEDAGDEITNSLPINGEAGMTGQFKAADGGALAPGIAFAADLNTGFRRSANNEMKWVAGGVDRATMNAQGKLTLPGGVVVSGDFTRSSGAFNEQTWISSASATPAVVLRRTEDDTNERELVQYMSGSGAGAKGSLRQVGGGSNDVATLRYYVNDVLAFQWTGTLFTHSLNVAYGASGIEADADGFFDFPELSAAPSAPAADVARVYARDDGVGNTLMFYRDGSGNEHRFQSATDRQVFTGSDTWTKPTDGQTMALVELWAGGGGGGQQGGAGGGAYSKRVIALASLSASVAVTIGAGGNSGGASSAGGSSSFGNYLSAFGGGGGSASSGTGDSGGGGGGVLGAGVTAVTTVAGSGGLPRGLLGGSTWGIPDRVCNVAGGAGGSDGDNGGSGGTSFMGGGGGGGFVIGGSDGGFSVFGGGGGSNNGFGAEGGSSVFGGNGGSNGEAGTVPGGGGGTNGVGARGEIRITCW